MAITKAQDKILSAKILTALRDTMVWAGVTNKDYEGEVKGKGDTVRIISFSDFNMTDTLEVASDLTDAETLLTIDREKYFNKKVDDKVMATTKLNVLDALAELIANAVSTEIDTYIASKYADIDAGNFIGTDLAPIELDKTNAYDYIVDLGTVLDDNNVPMVGRFVIIPNWIEGLLLKDDRFTKSNQLSGQTLTKGTIGEINGMQVLKSNNVPNVSGAKYKVVAGYRGAISHAIAINNVESYRPELGFADAVKGQLLYGVKVVRPTALACLIASKKAV